MLYVLWFRYGFTWNSNNKIKFEAILLVLVRAQDLELGYLGLSLKLDVSFPFVRETTVPTL